MGAWNCLLGAWICLLVVWICLLGAWNCLLVLWFVFWNSISAHLAHVGSPNPLSTPHTFIRAFLHFFIIFSNIWPLALPNIAKMGGGPLQNGRGVIGKAILKFVEKPSFEGKTGFGWIWKVLRACFEELNFQGVIKSVASAASRNPRGASGRRLGWRTTGTPRLPWDSCRQR